MARWKHPSNKMPEPMVAVLVSTGFDVVAAKYDQEDDAWYELRIGGTQEIYPQFWREMPEVPFTE